MSYFAGISPEYDNPAILNVIRQTFPQGQICSVDRHFHRRFRYSTNVTRAETCLFMVAHQSQGQITGSTMATILAILKGEPMFEKRNKLVPKSNLLDSSVFLYVNWEYGGCKAIYPFPPLVRAYPSPTITDGCNSTCLRIHLRF